MRTLARLADGLVRLLALVGALGVVAMMLHVCADVVLRAVAGRPLPATVEIVARYYMVALAFLPLAWVERRRGMVAVELADRALPPALLRASDAAVALLAAAVYAVLAWITWETFQQNRQAGTFVIALDRPVPVWQSYALPPLGFGLACATALARAAALLTGAEAERPEPADPA